MHFKEKPLNKKLVITGGASGLGRALALSFANIGASVAIAGRSEKRLKDTLTQMRKISKQKHLAIQTDVTQDEDVKNLFTEVQKEFGTIDGLIPAAGLYGSIGPFLERPFAEWGKAIQVNLIGAARTVYYAGPYFNPEDSRVILWSGGGQSSLKNFSDYVSSKGGIWRLTETLAAELAPKNVFVNAIAPGAVNTGFIEDLLAAGPDRVGHELYQKSLEQKEKGAESPEKSIELCHFLMSDAAKGLYGKTISAIWDDYKNWDNFDNLVQSDLYTFKRVIKADGGTRP